LVDRGDVAEEERGLAGFRIDPDPDLLRAVYQTAVTPDSYDALMERWQAQMDAAVAALAPEDKSREETDGLIDLSRTLPHLETSVQILESLGRQPRAGRGGARNPATGVHLMLDAKGRIVWYNSQAGRSFGLGRSSRLDALGLDEAADERLSRALAQMAEGSATGVTPRPLALAVRLEDASPLHLVASPVNADDGGTLMSLRSAGGDWNRLLAEMMREAFDLSDAELGIIGQLVEGYDLAEIAAARDRQLNTVRTQVKAILKKTHTHTQSQIIRLALNLAAHLPETGEGERLRADVQFVALPNGRRMPYRVLGPANGRPVIFLHGMLDGIAITEAIAKELHERGIKLIAPERPFFGSAPGAPTAPREALAAFSADLEVLCEHLKLSDSVVLGHMAGAVYAFAFADRAPGRVRAIVNVAGGVPITSPRQFAAMSPRQRLVAYTARYTPSALPFILRAGIRQIDAGGERKFVEALYTASPLDQQACRQQEIFQIITDGVRYAVAQGHAAFEVDSYHVVRDWSKVAHASSCPVHLVHGRHDPVVTCESVEGFAAALGERAQLHVCEEAGQLVYYTQPSHVLAVVQAALVDSN